MDAGAGGHLLPGRRRRLTGARGSRATAALARGSVPHGRRRGAAMGALRKAGVWLGLVEDDDELEYDDAAYDKGYSGYRDRAGERGVRRQDRTDDRRARYAGGDYSDDFDDDFDDEPA